jgi:hypothetical protein
MWGLPAQITHTILNHAIDSPVHYSTFHIVMPKAFDRFRGRDRHPPALFDVEVHAVENEVVTWVGEVTFHLDVL